MPRFRGTACYWLTGWPRLPDRSLPLVPGGLGIVEGSLAVVLAAYGAGRVGAVSAALAFRLVSFWLALAVGWVTAAVLARTMIRETYAGSDAAHKSPGS